MTDNLAETFLTLADTLADDIEIEQVAHVVSQRSVRLLGVDGAALVLADRQGVLRPVGASDEVVRQLVAMELSCPDGPSNTSHGRGEPSEVLDLEAQAGRWPTFSAAALTVGVRAIHSVPLRVREDTIGALTLFLTTRGSMVRDAGKVARMVAGLVALGILQQTAIRRTETTVDQLQGALTSRILIEQAKGILAERLDTDLDTAFAMLRTHARSHNRLLRDVARAVVDEQTLQARARRLRKE
ncbi:GAF and ANTAR domain-containing protein [Kutzneria viridogrisea]|uniref:ANTAR domain-containing protein n=1 Tax=Kutzneria viridogrisea TaxID=47990 RepID=A0ABR6BKM1_9PSEU|nr:GAF and ANTAR domain-containing protein [Kutzneria albida]MBA8927172.1 hypothetical protein [Kutzneria viridogrisea]